MFYNLVLLDSGYDVKNKKDNVDIYINNNETWELTNEDIDNVGHGGAVMNLAINGLEDIKAAVFKSFTDIVMSNIDNILSALTYIYENIECDYIQMSFGVRAYNQKLYDILYKLYNEKGVIIISAFDNCGAMSFPAAFSFVVGVSGNPFIKDKKTLVVSNTGLIDVYAKNAKQLVASKSETGRKIEEGNSFATSHVTNYLMRSNIKFKDKFEVMHYINSNYTGPKNGKKESVVGTRSVIFPLNKEMYSLVNYADKLSVELVDVYDIKYSGNVGRTISSFSEDKQYTVKNIDKCDWDNFDTMILGHQRELSYILGYDSKKKMLDLCLKHNKNVYSYDSILLEEYRDKFKDKNLILECPDDYIRTPRDGRLYQIQTPILCVLGTSKKQGKFTLQMQIKQMLEEKGVDLAVLGTEPNSILLGCKETLPIGYDSQLSNKTADEIIETFNEAVHRLDVENHDLILVGGQSGFLPHVKYNIGHINVTQIPFLYGVLPDGVILSIRYEDDIEYIKKSISTISVFTNSKVIMLALYAFKTEYEYVINSLKEKISDEEIKDIKTKYEKEFGIPVVVSGDFSYNDEIFDAIIKHYCK